MPGAVAQNPAVGIVSRALVAAVLAGCGHVDETEVHHADGIEIIHISEYRMCEGSIVALAAETERIRATFGWHEDSDPPASILVGGDAVADRCGEGFQGGCAWGFGEEAMAATELRSAVHELVHVVRRQHHLRGPLAVEEAVAVMLDTYQPFEVDMNADDVVDDLGVLLTLPRDRVDGTNAPWVLAHFLSYWMTSRGESSVWSFLASGALAAEGADSAFADGFSVWFGVELAAAESEWKEQSISSYTRGGWCTPMNTMISVGYEFKGAFDCDGPSTLGPWDPVGSGAYTLTKPAMCIRVETEGDYTVQLDAPERISLALNLVDATCDVWPSDPEAYVQKSLNGGDKQVAPFGSCSYFVRLSLHLQEPGDEDLPVDFTVRLTPAN